MDDPSSWLRSRLLVVVGLTTAGCSSGKSSDDSGCEPAREATIDRSDLSETGDSGTVDSCPMEKEPRLIEILQANEDVDCIIENLQLVAETERAAIADVVMPVARALMTATSAAA
jgi:hypothetical protein